MKCGRLAGWWMLVVFFLFVGGCFSSGFAADAPQERPLSRAAGLAAEAPKTPEEFLRLVRAWMDDPYMDGYEFAERITGIERGKWKKFPERFTKTKMYDPFGYAKEDGSKRPLNRIVVQINSVDHLWDMLVWLPHDSFCVSAALVRDILGEPNNIDIRLPNKYSKKQPYKYPAVYYKYKTDKYLLDIDFKIKQYIRNEIISMDRSRRRELLNMISKFEFYRDICAGGIRFGTYEGR